MLLIGADLVCEVPRGGPPALSDRQLAQQFPPRHAQNSAAARMAPPPSSPPSPPRPRPAIPMQHPVMPAAGRAAITGEATRLLPMQQPVAGRKPPAPPMPRRVPASVRGAEIPAAPEPVVPAVPHTTAWPDDAAAFNSGVDAARAHFSS